VYTGVNTDVMVDIEVVSATETLYAMAHIDAGNVGAYEFPGPDVPAQVGGEVVVEPFMVLGPTPSVTVTDQPLEDSSVTVDTVVSDGSGWMVIHAEAEGGGPGPVIGHSAVSDGTNQDVIVNIEVISATRTLYAMLHVDEGTVGEYEFPGPDVPAQVGGEVVVEPFGLMFASGAVTVDMINTTFDPAELVVGAGTAVTWVNQDAIPHTTTSDDGLWDSGSMSQDDTFSHTFDEGGVYPYYCTFHGAPGGVGMAGTVIVIP
jgi:plastocyanin